MDTEPAGVSDEIGLQNGTFTADPSSTELYTPPSPARSSLYATASHAISPAGAITTTMSTSLQPVMITLPTPASVHQTMPSSSQQLPIQHHSLQEHQTALTGQYTYIPQHLLHTSHLYLFKYLSKARFQPQHHHYHVQTSTLKNIMGKPPPFNFVPSSFPS